MLLVIIFLVLTAASGSFFILQTAHAGVIRRLGKFARIAAG